MKEDFKEAVIRKSIVESIVILKQLIAKNDENVEDYQKIMETLMMILS
ncbi:hypothetical protein [Prevotella dentalis]|nr:hypothetical protein [Prevotella dentalis]